MQEHSSYFQSNTLLGQRKHLHRDWPIPKHAHFKIMEIEVLGRKVALMAC